jgi:hypothetical protein
MSVSINTELKQNKHGNLTLDGDLGSIYLFRRWIKNNLLIYSEIGDGRAPDDDVPYDHVLIYLLHIEDLIIRNDISLDIDRSGWVKRIGKLIMKVRKVMGANDESE